MILFYGLLCAYLGVLVVSFWANKLGNGLSGKGMLITGLFSFSASCLLQLFAPDTILAPVLYISLGIVVLTLITLWISGN